MTTPTPTWDEVRRIGDEIQLKMHLAGMEARDRWTALQPRLADLETTIERQGKRAGQMIADELRVIGTDSSALDPSSRTRPVSMTDAVHGRGGIEAIPARQIVASSLGRNVGPSTSHGLWAQVPARVSGRRK